ncbi:hypothetical protein MKEN_00602800 [Mycena kentingensis (nom. inval.)]|nr:hypothetical protein MKEN_00602800 [Mycena kentingensis (nom. inval.)]
MAPPPRRALHDRTSYAIAPTPPSPSRYNSASPSLSPPSSNSTSASSSTELATPPAASRPRTRKQYPESIGRVPLHRRGTSKTYERLEDLLREAGYKETRIFTPEADRKREDDGPTVGAQVVGFLSSLVPSRSSSLRREDEPTPTPRYSPPASPSLNRTPRPSVSHAGRNSTSQRPVARRDSDATNILSPKHGTVDFRTQQQAHAQSQSVAYPRRTSNAGSVLSPRKSTTDFQQQQQQHQTRESVASMPPLPLHQPTPPRPVNRYYQHHPSASRSSAQDGQMSPPPLPRTNIHHPTPTRASTYLRHMTSYERPQSTPPTSSYARMTDDAEDESILSPTVTHPRMPTNWMENVKRAKEYFAASPSASTTHLPTISGSPPKRHQPLKRSVSVKTRGRLSDRTNAVPPLLTTRLKTGRAKRSESQVSVSRVVCRSRGSSPVRTGKGKAREADLNLHGQLELPNDLDFDERSRFVRGWGTSSQLLSPPTRRDVDLDSSSDISSEGEEEITLARILVPSGLKHPPAMERSRSVRSLRRCLELDGQAHEIIPPVPPLPHTASTPGIASSGRWSVSLSWGRARAEDETRRAAQSAGEEHDDQDDAYAWRSVNKRRRGGLPSWGS